MAIFNSYVSLPEGNGLKMFFHVGFAELCKLGRGITAEYSSNLGLYTQENWHSWGYKWGELYKHMAKKRTSVQISAYVYTHIYIHMHKPQLLQLYIYTERDRFQVLSQHFADYHRPSWKIVWPTSMRWQFAGVRPWSSMRLQNSLTFIGFIGVFFDRDLTCQPSTSDPVLVGHPHHSIFSSVLFVFDAYGHFAWKTIPCESLVLNMHDHAWVCGYGMEKYRGNTGPVLNRCIHMLSSLV